jgi:hypothetical protein
VGHYPLELEVEPLDERGATNATFKFGVEVNTPKPKLKLVVTGPTDYTVGTYQLTIPGKYEVDVKSGPGGMAGMPFAGMLPAMLRLSAVRDKYGLLNLVVLDQKMRRDASDIEEVLKRVRVQNKIRDFKTSPPVTAEIGGASFKYAVFRCSEMRLFGLTALGTHGDKMITFTAQQRGEDITDEFEEILKSFRIV